MIWGLMEQRRCSDLFHSFLRGKLNCKRKVFRSRCLHTLLLFPGLATAQKPKQTQWTKRME